ncbi:hypothetical protein H6P81_004889 [Aristolochia fimbriata]|uniref:Pre-rRNA-processing protein TSR2 homolog n=1 Tax=Aristolochia fimbriata TaxID=158543 RepID=A0AAV7ESY2_ARIFI|nr:hypothetical protein H6P81_004889 [Aristolochia fimbriata]
MAYRNDASDQSGTLSQLVSDLVAWFAQATVPHCIDDLENILDETMVLSFNTEVEDGSIEKVAEQLMIVHEECFQGYFFTFPGMNGD